MNQPLSRETIKRRKRNATVLAKMSRGAEAESWKNQVALCDLALKGIEAEEEKQRAQARIDELRNEVQARVRELTDEEKMVCTCKDASGGDCPVHAPPIEEPLPKAPTGEPSQDTEPGGATECPHCSGKGKFADPPCDPGDICITCKGRGVVDRTTPVHGPQAVTEGEKLEQELLALIRRCHIDGIDNLELNLEGVVLGGEDTGTWELTLKNANPSPTNSTPVEETPHWLVRQMAQAVNSDAPSHVVAAQDINMEATREYVRKCQEEPPTNEASEGNSPDQDDSMVRKNPAPHAAQSGPITPSKTFRVPPCPDQVEGLVINAEAIAKRERDLGHEELAGFIENLATLLKTLSEDRDGWKEYYDVSEKTCVELQKTKRHLIGERDKLSEEVGRLRSLIYRKVDPFQCDEEDSLIISEIAINFPQPGDGK